MLGNGDKKQYKDISELKISVKSIASRQPKSTVFLYFGDVSNKDKPDIGYAYELLSKIRPDIKIIMIQIDEMKKYGIPNFVNGGVFFHNNFDEKNKWGGFEKINGKYKAYSNTKQWLKLDTIFGIDHVFVLGEGGPITKQEINLIKKLNSYEDKTKKNHYIDITYYDLESRY